MALIFHFKYTLKCRLQFVPIRTWLKFCHLVIGQRTVIIKSKIPLHVICVDLHINEPLSVKMARNRSAKIIDLGHTA